MKHSMPYFTCLERGRFSVCGASESGVQDMKKMKKKRSQLYI